MREVVATLQNVRDAMLEIRAEGKTPTVRRIRTRLGGGSFKTINRFRRQVLEEWEVLERAGQEELSPEIKKAIFQDRLRAIDEATSALREKVACHCLQAEEALDDLEEAETQIEELRGLIAAEQMQHQQAIQQLEIAAARAAEKGETVAEMLRQTRSELESAIRDRELLRAENSRLQAELMRIVQSAEHAQNQAKSLEEQLRTAAAVCAAANERAAVANQQAKDAEAACRAAKQQCSDFRREYRQLQADHKALLARWMEMPGTVAQRQGEKVHENA